MTSLRPVVFYRPRGPGLDLPIDLLVAASQIFDREALIVDGRFEVAPEGRIGELAAEGLLLVVSARGGVALLDARRISESARTANRELPVLWLGAHASARPGECFAAGADACATGVAEQTVADLVAAIEERRGFETVPGLALPAGLGAEPPVALATGFTPGASRSTGLGAEPPVALATGFTPGASRSTALATGSGPGVQRTAERGDTGPPPSPLRYDRLDLEGHFRWRGERQLEYLSSRIEHGDRPAGERRWAGLPAEQVVAELSELAQRHRLTAVDFVDEEFFADLRRAEAIARGLTASGRRLAWRARGRAQLVRGLTEDAALALRQSGCVRVTIDAVSGSAAVRARAAGAPEEGTLLEVAQKLARHGVPAGFEFVAGVPGEPPTALHDTYRLARTLHRMAPATTTPIRLWRPDPAAAVDARDVPLPWPADLASWAAADARASDWVSAPVRRWAPRFDFYLRMAHDRPRRGLGRLLIHWLARLRVATGVYGLDFERALVELSRRLRTATKAARPGSIGWEP